MRSGKRRPVGIPACSAGNARESEDLPPVRAPWRAWSEVSREDLTDDRLAAKCAALRSACPLEDLGVRIVELARREP